MRKVEGGYVGVLVGDARDVATHDVVYVYGLSLCPLHGDAQLACGDDVATRLVGIGYAEGGLEEGD